MLERRREGEEVGKKGRERRVKVLDQPARARRDRVE
jgi:hypothetical protein